MSPKSVLNRRPGEEFLDAEANAKFGSAIGSFIYLMLEKRPGIAFALGTLSPFRPRQQSHRQAAAQRLLRYVKATQSHCIILPQRAVDRVHGYIYIVVGELLTT